MAELSNSNVDKIKYLHLGVAHFYSLRAAEYVPVYVKNNIDSLIGTTMQQLHSHVW